MKSVSICGSAIPASGIKPGGVSPKCSSLITRLRKGGTGLGLMIVERIMREHGGQVGIDSKEGVGTVVTLEFPKQNRKFRMLE